jgi:hypothetical protein
MTSEAISRIKDNEAAKVRLSSDFNKLHRSKRPHHGDRLPRLPRIRTSDDEEMKRDDEDWPDPALTPHAPRRNDQHPLHHSGALLERSGHVK